MSIRPRNSSNMSTSIGALPEEVMKNQIVKEREDLFDDQLCRARKVEVEPIGANVKPLSSLNEAHYKALQQQNMLSEELEKNIESYKAVKSRST